MINEIKAIYRNDPAARWLEIILYQWLHAIVIHKYISHPLYKLKLKFFARLFSQIARFLTWIEIHPWATIWKWLFIDHGMWTVIWETAEIWDNCVLFHNVTLWWTWNHVWKRHPTIWNDVLIWANATILWPCIIWNNIKIWAETFIINSILPDNSTVVWAPWKIVKLNSEKVDIKPEKII